MENQFPKNVRQIGNVSDSPKVYIEDYVDTFLNQLCDRAKEEAKGAFLVGEIRKVDEQDCVFIHGAIQIQDMEIKGSEITMPEDARKVLCEQCKEYFEEAQPVGWFVAAPGLPLSLNSNMLHIHEKFIPKENSIFVLKDPIEKEETYYSYKFKELLELGGHYIYYEKNPAMQNYMIVSRKQIGVTPSEVVEDRAAKDFRSIVRERMDTGSHKSNGRFVYAVSTFLVLVVLIIGITTINNYDKMQSVQSSIDSIAKTVSNQGQAPETQETSGTVVSEGQPQVAGDTGEAGKNDENLPETDQGITDTGQNATDPSGGQALDAGADETEADEPKAEDAKPEDAKAEDAKPEDAKPQGADDSQEIYMVQKGDTLAKISKKAYGDTSHVDDICRMNGLKDGNLIYIGQKLLLP